MENYLEISKGYKDVKDVFDLVDDIQKLRFYYSTKQYETNDISLTFLYYYATINLWIYTEL